MEPLPLRLYTHIHTCTLTYTCLLGIKHIFYRLPNKLMWIHVSSHLVWFPPSSFRRFYFLIRKAGKCCSSSHCLYTPEHSHYNQKSPINLMFMFFECGSQPGHLEKTHTGMSRTQEAWAAAQPGTFRRQKGRVQTFSWPLPAMCGHHCTPSVCFTPIPVVDGRKCRWILRLDFILLNSTFTLNRKAHKHMTNNPNDTVLLTNVRVMSEYLARALDLHLFKTSNTTRRCLWNYLRHKVDFWHITSIKIYRCPGNFNST